MTTNITEYLDNTELPKNLKNKQLIKFKGLKNNGKAEGTCIIGYIIGYIFCEYSYKYYYYYEEVNFIDNKKNGPYKKYHYNQIYEEGIYINDKKNGPYKMFLSNQIYEEGIYENNKTTVLIKDII